MDLSPCEEPGHKGQEFLWTKVPKAQPSELKLHSVTMKYVFSNLFSAYQKKKMCTEEHVFGSDLFFHQENAESPMTNFVTSRFAFTTSKVKCLFQVE